MKRYEMYNQKTGKKYKFKRKKERRFNMFRLAKDKEDKKLA